MARVITSRSRWLREAVRGRDVLDIGCVDHSLNNRTEGRWVHAELRSSARSVVGLDYEKAAIKQMQAEGYNVVWGDANEFDLGRQFDVVVAGEFIEHTPRPGDFFACVRRHLRPGGEVILTTPNAICLLYFVENCLVGHELDNSDHVCIFTETTMRVMLAKCGFDVVQTVFVAENVAHYQRTPLRKGIAHLMWFTQLLASVARPSMARHFITVAVPGAQTE